MPWWFTEAQAISSDTPWSLNTRISQSKMAGVIKAANSLARLELDVDGDAISGVMRQ